MPSLSFARLMGLATVLALAGFQPEVLAKQGINDSGMLLCLDSGGNLSSACANTGQDGEFGRDISKAAPKDGRAGFSFVKVCNSGELAGTGTCPSNPKLGTKPDKWGCTQDKVTGLIWEVKTSDGGLRDGRHVYTNHGDRRAGDASLYADAVNATKLCGASSWRFATPAELHGISDHSKLGSESPLDPQWFPNNGGASWTDTTDASSPADFAWSVGQTPARRPRWYEIGVMLVQGARAATPRFAANGDEIIDKQTGLTWRRCAEGMVWQNKTCTGVATKMFWEHSLAHARNVASQTGATWRVPNAKELFSIVSVEHFNPSIDAKMFPNTPFDVSCFWTSTPDANPPMTGMPSFVYCNSFNDGTLAWTGFNTDINPQWLRLVRTTN